MVDECSFCIEQRSTVIVQDNLILAHTDCIEMDLHPIGVFFFFEEKLSFLTNLPQSQIRYV